MVVVVVVAVAVEWVAVSSWHLWVRCDVGNEHHYLQQQVVLGHPRHQQLAEQIDQSVVSQQLGPVRRRWHVVDGHVRQATNQLQGLCAIYVLKTATTTSH